MRKIGAFLFVIGALITAPVFAAGDPAARLAAVDGLVLVNQGAGFTPVTNGAVLHAGDRLLSLKGAHARLIYANGCAVSLNANAMVTVAASGHGASCMALGRPIADTGVAGAPAQGPGDRTLVLAGLLGLEADLGVGIASGTTSP
jgi:hypothetical protein